MLAMAENFRQQYALLYPDHKALLLCPVNECGVQVHTANMFTRHGNITTNVLNTLFSITFSYSNVYQQKFVSTTLRSTLLPYPELYDWEGCSSFVADYLSLELLDPPFELVRICFDS